MAGKSGTSFLNKRGSIQDLIYVAVVALFFGLVLLFGFKMATEFNTHIQADGDMPAEAKASSTTLTGYYPGVMDNMFLFLVIGLAIGVMILAALVRIHPIFIPIFFMVWVIMIVLCGVLSNVYQEMAANAELITLANQLTFTSHVLTYLPFIIGVLGILLMVIMYKTWQVQQI